MLLKFTRVIKSSCRAAHMRQAASAADLSQAGQVLGALEAQWQGGGPPSSQSQPVSYRPASSPGAAGGGWVQVAAKQLVGLYTSVWVRRALLPHVRGVQATTTATGFGGWAGNKGEQERNLR